jgi:tRNA(Arg) A34 adenosine deaminase TadA
MNLAQALAHLRRANDVARAAMAQGHHPFGACWSPTARPC